MSIEEMLRGGVPNYPLDEDDLSNVNARQEGDRMNTNEMNMARVLRQKDAEIERLNEQLERERQQAREAIDAVRNGEPLGSIAGKHMIRNQQVEIERLNEVIDRAAKAWMSLEPPVAWEGDVADAMAAGVAEIGRLRTWIENAATDEQLDAPVSALGGQTGRQLLGAFNTEKPT